MRRCHRVQLGALALVAIACSDATGPAVASTDLASALAEMSLSSIVPAFAPMMVRGVSSPSFQSLVPSQCAYVAASQSFVCAAKSADGVTTSHSYVLLDASGASQMTFDPATTASIRTMFTASGTTTYTFYFTTRDSLRLSETIDAHSTMTLSGLLTGVHVLNGTDVVHTTEPGFFGGALTSTATSTIAGLVPAPAGSANPYPRAGSIAIAFDESGAGSPPMRFTITMVFNGTSKVAVTYTSNGGAPTHCTIDLAATGAAGAAGAAGFESCFGGLGLTLP